MYFLLDENVPHSLVDTLNDLGHEVTLIQDVVPAGSPDPIVATIGEELDAVLVSFDGDFQRIAPRIPRGMRTRFRRLSRISLKCNEPQVSARMVTAMSLIELEFEIARNSRDQRMIVWLGDSYIRTDR